MSSPAQTPASSPQFNFILDAALTKYQKTRKNILSYLLAVDPQCCGSVDAILAIPQGQAKTFEQFEGGDRRSMEGIRLSLVGRADIGDALKRLDNPIWEEHQVATVRVLKVTSELRDGALSTSFPPRTQ
ncbi:hypothetical protein BJY52DRAFT_1415272 [Lactarius psammicola]|nr:hypothetical protein BJY52DRAFT_1415272 [Lactarius psammicola]